MAVLQPLIDLAQLCHLHGVTSAVISPGSRSAALTLAFARNPAIECRVVMDERAAAFIALGMAQQQKKPVALICTSGSAAYNFAPAVAEAFFQQIPLLVFTADRPKEWIHQNDGQTIYQSEIYGRHVKGFWELPADYSHPDAIWFINRSVNEALLLAQEFPFGPVHINVPIREPFYPKADEDFLPAKDIRIIKRVKTQKVVDEEIWQKIEREWKESNKILIAVGQIERNDYLNQLLMLFSEKLHIPVLGDAISNLNRKELFISKHDLFLNEDVIDNLCPDLLITLGKSFISKNFKNYIRKSRPKKHWHIAEDVHVVDTFQTLTQQINISPESFLVRLYEVINGGALDEYSKIEERKSFQIDWVREERDKKQFLKDYLAELTTLDDITAINFVLSNLPKDTQLHLANSMTVRYVNILGIDQESVEVFCNRGTSGIDGCVSTAIGAALNTDRHVFLIVGDVAFFYDRNGLLVENLPQNLKIILINNRGGVIFRMIDGPASQPELQQYFETRHEFNARRTAEDSNIRYFLVQHTPDNNLNGLSETWKDFVDSKSTSIIEIQTNPELNERTFRDFKKFVRSRK